MINLSNYSKGLQHIGIPTRDIEKTIEFYTSLGFEVKLRTVNEAANEKVAFISFENITIETYENGKAPVQNGNIDHIAIDVKNIDELFNAVTSGDYVVLDDKVQSLPFWEKGVRFFTILGPNEEKVEFCERL